MSYRRQNSNYIFVKYTLYGMFIHLNSQNAYATALCFFFLGETYTNFYYTKYEVQSMCKMHLFGSIK